MAYDDDDWLREQQRLRREAEYAAACARTTALEHARRAGDLDKASDLFGIPRADLPGAGRAPAASTHVPTAEEQFGACRGALLAYLEWVYDFILPEALCRGWAREIEPLELWEPVMGRAVIEGIRDEYRRAVERYRPPDSEVSSRSLWDTQVPRIGDEIERMEGLFHDALRRW